ncbi:sulfotransferase [Microbacterium sp. bgisy189]|uniref:sulfotransferase n=1 Tax=Microbacterium sp. bgisy189 TaxID=3413798 RepID=UPI003EB9DED0
MLGTRHERPDRAPILVTGVPRSGTTWLARLLAQGNGLALAGREPMNPRRGQYALGGTLSGWARVTNPTPAQQRALALAYRGLNPLTYSRYGHRQWAAPWPRTRVVIKDPFAMLSVPAVMAATGARAVLLYRHPGAVLASYRRMGWSPDLAELRAVLASVDGSGLPELPEPGEANEVEAMCAFWSVLHALTLRDVVSDGVTSDGVHIVSHHELASGGTPAGRTLASRLGIGWNSAMAGELSRESSTAAVATQLHNFDRSPAEVADAWRANVSTDEVEILERVAKPVWDRLESARTRLGALREG